MRYPNFRKVPCRTAPKLLPYTYIAFGGQVLRRREGWAGHVVGFGV